MKKRSGALNASMAFPGGVSISMKSYDGRRGIIKSDNFVSSPGSNASSIAAIRTCDHRTSMSCLVFLIANGACCVPMKTS